MSLQIVSLTQSEETLSWRVRYGNITGNQWTKDGRLVPYRNLGSLTRGRWLFKDFGTTVPFWDPLEHGRAPLKEKDQHIGLSPSPPIKVACNNAVL